MWPPVLVFRYICRIPRFSPLQNSPLYVHSLYQPGGYCILANGGYPCQRGMQFQTPCQGLLGHWKSFWHHEKQVEIFSFFFKALAAYSIFKVKAITRCGLLHNPRLSDGGIVDPVEEEPGSDDGKNELQRDPQLGSGFVNAWLPLCRHHANLCQLLRVLTAIKSTF